MAFQKTNKIIKRTIFAWILSLPWVPPYQKSGTLKGDVPLSIMLHSFLILVHLAVDLKVNDSTHEKIKLIVPARG